MARAAAERLLVLAPNHGFIVARTLTTEEYHSLFAIRLLLEEEAIRSLADPQGLAADLQTPLDQMRAYGGSPEFEDRPMAVTTVARFRGNAVTVALQPFAIT